MKTAETDGTIIQFLHGSHSFDGVWFGEPHPIIKGQFWWRRFLPQPHTEAINSLSNKIYGCDYDKIGLPKRRAELLEKYLGIERKPENEVSPRE